METIKEKKKQIRPKRGVCARCHKKQNVNLLVNLTPRPYGKRFLLICKSCLPTCLKEYQANQV